MSQRRCPAAIPTLWELTTHGGTRGLVPRGWGRALLELHVDPRVPVRHTSGLSDQIDAARAAAFPPDPWEYR
jgi:hypothetical protein